jgi:hypothetical protein
MKNLLSKIDFGNEAADDVSPDEIIQYFVEQKSFNTNLNKAKKILISTARKGVGKSALLKWTQYKLNELYPDSIIIHCRGADLVRSKFHLNNSINTPNEHIRDWMIRICALINRELTKYFKIGITDDKITLIETAELDGYKSRNLVSCLLDRITNNLNIPLPRKQSIKDEIEIFKRVKSRKIWFLIDDLDATFQQTELENLELSSFFTACRYLIQDVKDIYFRITMRTDVWSIIRRYDESLDKMEQYVQDINWSLPDFRKLLYKRIKSQFDLIKYNITERKTAYSQEENEEYLINYLFVPKMDWSGKDVFTYHVIFTLSYERPRWAIQLCKLAQDSALLRNSIKIDKDDINDIWAEYGKKRISDLVAEHKHQCRQVEELVNAFRGCERLLTRADLCDWINRRILDHLSPTIEGEIISKSSIPIARFLYRIGFIIARSNSPDGSYEHYHFHEMPDFLSSRTDSDFGLSWEIHPCYREALDIKKLDYSHRQKFIKRRHTE